MDALGVCVQGMEEMGNERAKTHFEAEVPSGYPIPREHATVREREKWIRDKYEHKRFVSRGPPPTQRNEDNSNGSRSSRRVCRDRETTVRTDVFF